MKNIRRTISDFATAFVISYGATKMAGDAYSALSKNIKSGRGKTALQVAIGLVAGFGMTALITKVTENSNRVDLWLETRDVADEIEKEMEEN